MLQWSGGGAPCCSVYSDPLCDCFTSPGGGTTRWPSDSVRRRRRQPPASESESWGHCSPRTSLHPPVAAERRQSSLNKACEQTHRNTLRQINPTCVPDSSIFWESAVTTCPQICCFQAKAHTVIPAMLTSNAGWCNYKTLTDNEFIQGTAKHQCAPSCHRYLSRFFNKLTSSSRVGIFQFEFRLRLFPASEASYTMHCSSFCHTPLISKTKLTRLPCQHGQYINVHLCACYALSSRAEQNIERGTQPGLVPSCPGVSLYCFCTILSDRLSPSTEDTSTILSEAVAQV